MIYFLIFLFGLAIGSFLNVLIDRLSRDKSIRGRSHCPRCGVILRWLDLIPVLSFILLRGRCRSCQEKISWQYPVVEITTGLLFLLIFFVQGAAPAGGPGPVSGWDFIYYLFIVSCLIVIFVSDLKYYIIPDQIIYSAVGITFFYRIFEFSKFDIQNLFGVGDWGLGVSKLGNFLMAAVLAGGFFFLLVAISRGRWMGMGDVKLVFLMGLILGWPNILIALFLSFFSGALIGSALVIFNKKTWKSEIPFGTFLSVNTLLILFYNLYKG